MASEQVASFPSVDNPTTLPVLITSHVEQNNHAHMLETLIALEDDFKLFRSNVIRQMVAHRKAFSGVAGPLYKDVFNRLVGDDRMSLPNSALFQGWHSPACLAEEHLRDALEEMLFAFWQAKTYTKAMQRNRG